MSKTVEEKRKYDREYRRMHRKEESEKMKMWREKNKNKITDWLKQYRQTPIGRAVYLCNNYKRLDKKYNRRECTVTAQWIVDNIFTKPCVYCGETDWRKLGCDRIDNDLPHTLENVVCCCEECNKKKGKRTYEEFKNT